MRAPLSVIIPTLDAAPQLAKGLAPLVSGVSEGLIRELILSDGGSRDDIAELAEGIGAHLVRGEKGRGGQLARGAEAASGDWLLFLHADTLLPPGWVDTVFAHIESSERAAVFRLAFDAQGLAPRLVAGWANTRSTLLALPYGDQGLLISRPLYRAIGGYRPIPLMEDVDMIRRLGRARITLLPATVITSAAKYERDGWGRRGLRNWSCLARYYLGVAPDKIAERY
ncbi:MAG: TIGR04283 family arsenosugar biosynthesis glycosyltransferase [Neomegalonema sp.]|nr:TIGR04283 family arsenosugar biosynthesis glycosyltransferase [Neomegalonema sp.]